MIATDGNRIPALDTLRGFALFGICVVNVPFLAMPVERLVARQGGLDGFAQFVVEWLFQGKFFVLFSFLFGWGFAIQMASAVRAGVSGKARFLRRLLGLALIGVAHATLVFNGDILVLYAVLGSALMLLTRTAPRQLMAIAAAALFVGAIALLIVATSLPELATAIAPVKGRVAYLGGFFDAASQRIRDWPTALAFILLFNGPIAFAAFCAGLAAAKSGFFERGNVVYLALRGRLLLLLLLAVGLPLNAAYALSVSGLLGDGPSAALAFAGLSVGGPCLAAVYLVGAIEASRRGWFQGATAAAGRMSLTAYVTEGVLAGVVFNGYGLSLYGQVGLFGCFGIAVAIYAVTHTFAALWLRAFSHGPLEALLKAITRSGESAARRV